MNSSNGKPKEMYIAVGGTQAQIKILDCMKQVVSTVILCSSSQL